MKEVWKTIPKFENYQVSSLGRVRRIYLKGKSVCKLLTPSNFGNHKGYTHVNLYDKDGKHIIKIHVLVMRVFIGPAPIGCEVNHQDGVKFHNWLDNLKYETRSENAQHASKMGLLQVGEAHYASVLTVPLVKRIKGYVALDCRDNEIASLVGCHEATIWKIRKQVTWKHVT